MKGPFPRGTHKITWVDSWEQRRGLVRGQWYRVLRPFADRDGDQHVSGEEWKFVAAMFSPIEQALMICVGDQRGEEWRIILQWSEDRHQDVIEHFNEFVQPIEKAGK